jgi:excisionase family DNA binding protein
MCMPDNTNAVKNDAAVTPEVGVHPTSAREGHVAAGAEGVDAGIDDRLVFTVAEAGTLLGISRAFAYELVARGELPVIRLGRRRLVPKVALLALVALESPKGARTATGS